MRIVSLTNYKVLAREISQRQVEYDKHYLEVESRVKSMMNTDVYELLDLSILMSLLIMKKLK